MAITRVDYRLLFYIYIIYIFIFQYISFDIFIVWVDYQLLLGTELIRKAPEK